MTPNPASERGVKGLEFVLWLLQTILGSVIGYGVYRVLDFFFKRR